MTQVTFKNNEVATSGQLPEVGQPLPDFYVISGDLKELRPADFAGKRLVISFFPSVDTGVCAQSVRTFNQKAAELENTVVLNISRDLPFAQSRFCAAEGIDNVEVASDFRGNFGEVFGAQLEGSPLAGLLARGVVVTDDSHTVRYAAFVPEVTDEPDYEAALAALQS